MSRRSKNIYKRKDGRWEGWYIAGHTAAGKANYRSVYAHSYNEVKQKLEETALSGSSLPVQRRASMSVKGFFVYNRLMRIFDNYPVFIWNRGRMFILVMFFARSKVYRMTDIFRF